VSVERLHDRFVRLCEMASPTGSERAIADSLIDELRGFGLDVEEDDAAAAAGAGAGNLIARLHGPDERFVMLCAHIDTVPHDDPIEVALNDGVYTSRGNTILGADDKAALSSIVELAAGFEGRAPPIGLELVLTVAEETGLRGAAALDTTSLRSEYGFVLDHASPIGEVIVAAPTYKKLVADFEGVAAHSGIRPEDGRSAIAAAGDAITEMRLGRLDGETSANVGVIKGGSATNIVPRECRVEAEARSLDHARASEVIGSMVDACTWAAGEHGCDVGIEVSELFRGYRISPGSVPASIARAAVGQCGHEVTDVVTGGGSDANAFISAGFDCVLLANGTKDNHAPVESVEAARLDEMLEICEAIVELSASQVAES
jgi:tripeptide aminopeptidase